MNDIEVIENINKYSFTYIFNEISKNKTNIDILINYINLFLTRSNNEELFISNAKEDTDKYIEIINFIVQNFNLKTQYKKIIIGILLNKNLITIDNINNNLLNLIIDDDELLKQLFENNNNINIFENLINNYQNEKKICEFFYNIINNNKCRNKYQKNEDDFKIIKNNENMLYKILELLLSYWDNLVEYQYNKCSNIKNYLIKYNNNEINKQILIDKYSNYFFILLNLINVTIYYNISKETELTNMLKLITSNKDNIHNLNNIWNDFLNMRTYYNNLLDTKYKHITEEINKINKLLKNDFLYKIKLFYNNFITQIDYIITDKNNIIDNTFIINYLENIIDFSIYCINRKVYSKKNDFSLMLFFFKIINNKMISNFNINQKSIDFLLYYILANISYIKKEISIINSDIINTFYLNIINFYVELDANDDYSKNDTKYKIIYIIRLLSKNNKNEDNIFAVIFNNIIQNNNNNKTIKFLNSVITDINFYLEELILYLKNSENYLLLIKTLYSILIETLNFMKFCFNNKSFHNIIFNDEILINFINYINLHIKNIIDLQIDIFNVTNNYNLSEVCLLMLDIYITLNNINSQKFILIMSKDTRSFDINIFQNLIKLLLDNNKISNETHDEFKLLLLEIKKVNDIELQKNNENIPEELCDPLINSLFSNPIILPTSEITVDLLVIKRHLLVNNTDPFNRSPLTIEDIEKYNKKPDVIKKINELKIKIKNYKESIS